MSARRPQDATFERWGVNGGSEGDSNEPASVRTQADEHEVLGGQPAGTMVDHTVR